MKLTPKELDRIREIAIRMYATENPGATLQDSFRFRVIVEATVTFLQEKGVVNEPSLPKPGNEG